MSYTSGSDCDKSFVSGQTRKFNSRKIDEKVSDSSSDTMVADFAPSVRHAVRGCRGGFYSKHRVNYNGILGVNAEQYNNILAKMEVIYFGTPIHEGLRARFGARATLAIDDMGFKLPPTQQIKLLSQLWLDMATAKTTESLLVGALNKRSNEYNAKFDLLSGKQETWGEYLYYLLLFILTLGFYETFSVKRLPRRD